MVSGTKRDKSSVMESPSNSEMEVDEAAPINKRGQA